MVCFLCHPRLTGCSACYWAPWFLRLQELWGLLSTMEAARLLRLNLQPGKDGRWLSETLLGLFHLLFFFFVSWSAVTILPCPLGSACRENPIIAEDLMQYLWTSWVAHLDMGKWGEIWNFQQSEALSPPPVSGSICSIMGSSFPELPWSRSGLASSSSLIFNISNIFPARAPVTAVCFKSTN